MKCQITIAVLRSRRTGLPLVIESEDGYYWQVHGEPIRFAPISTLYKLMDAVKSGKEWFEKPEWGKR